jgi:outer membrane protein assembly factor BamB
MILLRVLLVLVAANPCWAEDWARFRGPNGTGVVDDSVAVPSLEDNLLWNTVLPPGHSSPIVVGNHIYLTAFENEELLTLALDRNTGRILWRRQAPRPRRAEFNEQNNPASSTPASDGENVYVFFGEYGLLSYGPDGNERWRVPLGPFINIRGMAASPIVVEGKLLITCDDDSGSAFLLALDAATGDEVWRGARPGIRKGFSTPAIYRSAEGPVQVIAPGSFTVISYALDTGAEIWRVGGLCWQVKAVPQFANGRVHVNCQGASADANAGRYPSYRQALDQFDADGSGALSENEFYERRRSVFWEYDFSKNGSMEEDEWNFFVSRMATRPGFFAIRLDGKGDVSQTHVDWVVDRPLGNVPTPLIYDGVAYSIRNAGILTSIDIETGEILKQGRLTGALGAYYASPVAADGKIFFLDADGMLTVVRAGGDWSILHSLALDDGGSATPAIVDGNLYVRTYKSLYGFGE